MLKFIEYPQRNNWARLLARPAIDNQLLESSVSKLLSRVKRRGDAALRELTWQFDGARIKDLRVSEAEIKAAGKLLGNDLKSAITMAKDNIAKFHAAQKEEMKVIETTKGVKCWRRPVPIRKVGLYIPGGSAPLFSTLLMLGVPAKLAGCKEIVLCTPPDKTGTIAPEILYTAKLLGITRIFKVGGAQAIGAMAFGTESVPAVYKIFGPGNQYVTCAKQLVSRLGVAIDLPAGPSELAVWADSSAVPAFVAADLLSQAEHGPDSQVILVSESALVISKVVSELRRQVEKLPRKKVALTALTNSRAFLVKNKQEAIDLINLYAPEHLVIACKNSKRLAAKVENAGSVFLGNYSCESAGDYASGTNHTLPTNGCAKAYSGVSLDSFVKKITFQELSAEGIRNLGRTIELMAEAEGLFAHKNAVSLRLQNIKRNRKQ